MGRQVMYLILPLNKHNIVSIVAIELNGKYNYPKWLRKITHTLIFNALCDGIREGENDVAPTKPTTDNLFAIWKNKYKKVYALIVTTISEEVSCHIIYVKKAYGALNKLKDLYDSHL